ncbi:MAG: hypothetical protein HY898_28200 [Deltaproteobacteria bacterium]|nr:hypothetical protein [Deltaproteobacteria bacterium]
MGKRNRADRRKARQEKAVSTGDTAAIRALCERNATVGAKALLRCLQSDGQAEPNTEMLELAARTAQRLRADCNFELALELAAAGRGRSESLLLQEAVAAFACGNDARVRELASQSQDVATMTAPWLAAVAGQRVPNAPAGSTGMGRGIPAVCRTVSSMVQGNASRTRAALTSLGQPERGRLFVSELLGAVALLTARDAASIFRSSVPLAKSKVIRSRPATRAALAMTVARRAPRLFLDKLSTAMDLGDEATRDAAVAASCTLAEVDGAQAQVSQMIARLGADAFDPSERANALLHEGFAFCGSDPRRARTAIDRAVALGADMIEALRGRLLLERGNVARETGPFATGGSEALRAVMSNALSLAQHLERDPAGGPLAVAALIDATKAAIELGQRERTQTLVARMRDLAVRGGFLTEAFATRIDVFEARACLHDLPARAKELAESLLARDPLNHDAWHIQIDVATRSDRKAAEDLILRAAELKVCQELIEEARGIRKERGISQTFVPGQTTAGELAAEMRSRLADGKLLGSGEKLGDDIESCRAALDSDHRTAFDIASIMILGLGEQPKLAHARAMALLSDPALPPSSHHKLLAAVIVGMEPEAVSRFVQELAATGKVPFAIEAVKMLVADDQCDAATQLLAKLARRLSSSELRSLQKLMDDSLDENPLTLLPNPDKLISAADRLLSPDFSLPPLLDDDAGEHEDAMGFEDELTELVRMVKSFPGGRGAVLEQLLKVLGMPRSALSGMPASAKRAFDRSIEALFSSENPKLQAQALFDALGVIGIVPAMGGGPAAVDWEEL